MKRDKKKKGIKLLLIIIIVLALILQFIFWPEHDENHEWFPKQIFNALKNI